MTPDDGMIVRQLEGIGPVRSPAYWLPVRWVEWDDAGFAPSGIPTEVWTKHHGHVAQMRQSAFGFHGFHCTDCRFWWREGRA